jgi:hypothetical protein
MRGAAVGTGLQLVGGWLDCGVGAVRRLVRLLEPLARLGARPLLKASSEPTAPEEKALPANTSPETDVEAAKYWLGPAPERPLERWADRESGELPRSYGEDRIVLLPRDAWWVFTYWEITPTTRVRALRALGAEAEGAREVLRVYDVTFITFTGDNAWLSFDVDLPPGADHWYLNVSRPAASFCVEVGVRTAAGRFLPLARSNVVTTARASVSPDTSLRWVRLGRGGVREATARPPRPPLAAPAGADGATDGRPRSSDVHAPRPPR